jgi:hypothetical protein
MSYKGPQRASRYIIKAINGHERGLQGPTKALERRWRSPKRLLEAF